MNEAARIAYLGALGIDVWWPRDAFAEPASAPVEEMRPAAVQALRQHTQVPETPAPAAVVTQTALKTPAAHISELQQSLQRPVEQEVPEFTLQFMCFAGVWLVFARQQISQAHAMLLADIACWRGSNVLKPSFMADFVWPYIRDGKIDQSAEQARRHLAMFMGNLHQQQPAQEVLVFADASVWLAPDSLAGVKIHMLPVALLDCLAGAAAKRSLYQALSD